MNIIQIISCLFVKQPAVNFKCTQKGNPVHSISYKLECRDTNSSEDYKNELGFDIKNCKVSLSIFHIPSMNRSILRKENIKDYDNDGYEEELFWNKYEYENIKSQSRRVHLAYHPV
ncbi:hypothetical protein POVWA2_083730 [Plasmodium ovale wallikeri]|uniref:Uncharacterized protein n=1 Tax=Plasmodium ovale wallikeri TaxID=864142 RepID=A0A1A9APP6_PLAOA|nr:hypothetical protein POVWA1_067510 [Plasmodium ovale wallikeri]SBT58207.1 hypothetical protein POVWA2_083730 [Plasmodium ovale wallikeri]